MTRTRRGLALVALVLAALGVPALDASAASRGEVADLAQRASAGDAGALADLRTVEDVDGVPVDLEAALDTDDPGALDRRLEALAAPSGGSAGIDAAGARADARGILAEGRFERSSIPRPFTGLLERIDRLLDRVFGPVVRWINDRVEALPGSARWVWAALAVTFLVLVFLGARRLVRRRVVVARRREEAALFERADPRELARAADAAEREGRYADAVRLRFRAGLLELGAREVVPYRDSLLTADVARRLRSPDFDALAQSFERIAYGDAEARPADAESARERWDAVLAGTAGRPS